MVQLSIIVRNHVQSLSQDSWGKGVSLYSEVHCSREGRSLYSEDQGSGEGGSLYSGPMSRGGHCPMRSNASWVMGTWVMARQTDRQTDK